MEVNIFWNNGSHGKKPEFQDHYEESVNLSMLPVEVLVYIMSFLRTARDLVKLRYVSRKLRAATETPSLWTEFVWPLYHSREERSVMNVLKDFGRHVKRLTFPNHVAQSKLLEMINCCGNLTHLTLPAVTELDSDELKYAVQHMSSLEKLEVRINSNIKPLLLIVGLKQLTIHVIENDDDEDMLCQMCQMCITQWLVGGFVPPNLVLVSKLIGETEFLLTNRFTPRNNQLCCFMWYYNQQVPLNLYPAIPAIRLEFGQSASPPFVKASSNGILGLTRNLILLTGYVKNGKTLYKADFTRVDNIREEMINNSVNILEFVTEFSFDLAGRIYPGHLEQLAFACPNLKSLDLSCCSDCLSSLHGLRTIAQNCKHLCGLNLVGISLKENKYGKARELWHILSGMRLTYLSMEVCIFMFCKYSIMSGEQLTKSLQALQLYTMNGSDRDGVFYFCEFCEIIKVDGSLLSNFSELRYCRLFAEGSNIFQDITMACKKLVCLCCETYDPLLLTSLYHPILEQLCIYSVRSDVPSSFMDTISAHGRLVHVIMIVCSVTAEGVINLITNSPGLLTLIIVTREYVYNEQCVRVHGMDIKATVKKKFPHRRLFYVGDYRVLQDDDNFEHWKLEDFLYATDLQPLWM